ncbi:MAG TPA: hypothetical protein VFG87_21215 [Amycolatopsis sp.]|jgi:hypothetical protein|nr:hypothetical protein [Amycolatopsis sp.]
MELAPPRGRREPELLPPTTVVRAGSPRRRPRGLAVPALAAGAALLWLLGLHPVLPTELGSLGLIAALSPATLLAYPVLLAAVVLELLRRPFRPRVLAAMTALGVVMVYGLQPASEQTARITVSWLHTGFAGYIADNGQALQGFDARFSWPGFFSLIAFLTKAAGQPDASGLLQWAPMILAGLAVLGMRALAVTVLGDGRAAWLATWVFLLSEWTEQDYFSPQATTYILMLATLALTARYLVRPGLAVPLPFRGRSPRPPPMPRSLPRERLAVQGLIVLFALALAVSHQLTSLLLFGLLLVLALTRRLWSDWLPWLVLVPALVWFALGAKDFWWGQLHLVIGGLGKVGSSVDEGFTDRFVGDAGRTAILVVRVGLTIAVGTLAAAGWWTRRRRGLRAAPLPLLAIAPLVLVVLQSYGGEVFVRCYLFALPFAAILVASWLDSVLGTRPAPGAVRAGPASVRTGPRLTRARVVTVGVILTLLGVGTVVARGGNDAYTSFSRTDVAAVAEAYRLARPGQTISGISTDALPLGFSRIGVDPQSALAVRCPSYFADPRACVLQEVPDYFLVTPSEDNYGRIYYGLPAGWTTALAGDLVHDGKYRVVFDENGSKLLTRVPGGP